MRAVDDADPFVERTAYVVTGERSGRFGVYFDITNTGRLPIRIEGLGEDGDSSLVPQLKLHSGVLPGDSRFPGFDPFTLESGDKAFLGLEVVATKPCDGYVRGSSIVWDSVTLRYRYARFFERQASIPLPVGVSLAC
ncbi:MAG: hypothetical protein ACRDNG_08640 [Gaiellaceae bacterium]